MNVLIRKSHSFNPEIFWCDVVELVMFNSASNQRPQYVMLHGTVGNGQRYNNNVD